MTDTVSPIRKTLHLKKKVVELELKPEPIAKNLLDAEALLKSQLIGRTKYHAKISAQIAECTDEVKLARLHRILRSVNKSLKRYHNLVL
jgi:hypothetical protein